MQRILVIEDDAGARYLFTTVLEEAGYEVFDAPDGAAGIRTFHETPCDLVLTDIFMPEKEGLETIFELKSEYPDLKIVAVSGGTTWIQHGVDHNSDNILHIAKTMGADRTLMKPINIQKLLETIGELLHRE